MPGFTHHSLVHDTPAVDIIVVTYNNSGTIEALLESIQAQNIPTSLYCIDNSPNHRTYALFNKLTASRLGFRGRWYHSPVNLGFGAAVNKAASMGQGEWIFIMNPDAAFTSSSDLAKLIAASEQLEHGKDAVDAAVPTIVGPALHGSDGSSYPTGRVFPGILHGSIHAIKSMITGKGNTHYLKAYSDTSADVTEVDWVSGAAMLMRREVFDSLGGFDERYFMYAEDMDLCWRLRKNAHGVVARVNAVSLLHIGGVSSGGGSWRTLLHHHRSLGLFLQRTTSGPARIVLPIIQLGLVVRLLIMILRRHLVPQKIVRALKARVP